MTRSGFIVMRRLIGQVGPLTPVMLLAIAMGLAGHLCATAITVLASYGVLDVLGEASHGGGATATAASSVLTTIIVIMAFCAVVRGFLRYAEQACNHYIAFKLLALMRDRVFQALRRLAPAKLEGRDRGDLISVITSDIELLEVFYAHTISPVVIAVLFCVAICAFVGSFHPALVAVAAASFLIVGVICPLAAARMSGDAGARVRNGAGALSSFVLETLRGLDEIMQFSAGTSRLNEMDEQTDALAVDELSMKRAQGASTGLTSALILGCDLVMFLATASLYQAGVLTFNGVLIPTLTLMSSFGPVVALANLGSTLQSTFAAGNRVLDILDDVPVTPDIMGEPEISFNGASAQNVSFSYDADSVLSDISLAAPAGRIVGITGRSGSGKSTLLRLFMRFWDTTEGTAAISGRDVRAINTNNLRNLEAFVTQETHLFHDSIRNNVRIARLDATDQEIEAACRRASVHEFIASLPQGYDTPVGELGETLSGGERQRLGLARAFLHDAPFMLLDEPTSNLDSLNEAVILRSIREEGAGKTVLLVSHRASTMRIADEVVSVEHGRMS